ncbi:MAG TPA: methyltransferase domain-containing protein [Actinophytocola sp.]|uniref:class I SAM-dependent methyltransferase n=1 Tax=Actinophytocola sp. TaxID=1872138 RepID=UPI002DDCC533|nr:methyltransferase domain-containing protein [Actinophytocola sp.]HEV2783508.1 methyltransferase domain-containing protein [Actinophytocola sp.]
MGVLARARERLRAVDVVPSPNIWHWPEIYEVENRAQDVGGEIWRVLGETCDWAGRDVLDVGCGDGFHLPRFAATARSVLGVEPYEPLVRRARRRVAGLSTVEVRSGSAQRLPVPDASVDLVHARTAYFFGPGCQPGLREADRVLRPGGMMVIVDLDATVPPYGEWLRADLPAYHPAEIDAFFERAGFACQRVRTTWRFADRESLAAVLRIEFSARVAARARAEVTGLSFPVGYRVLTRRKPAGLLVG